MADIKGDMRALKEFCEGGTISCKSNINHTITKKMTL